MTHFRGVFSTPMTPFDADGALALDLIEPYFAWQAEHGVAGVFVLGTWGGFAVLDIEERRRAAAAYCAAAKQHGLQVIVHVGCHAMRDSLTLAAHAADCGADAVSSVVPQYYSTAGYLGLDDYKRHFGTLAAGAELPLYLYNNPRTTAVLLSPAEAVALCEVGVAGVKDGSKSVAWIMQMQEQLAGRGLEAQILPGNSVGLVYGRLYGCDAVTSGAAVVFPDETAEIHRLLDAGDVAGAVRQHRFVLQLRQAIGLCSAPPAAAHHLLRNRGHDYGLPRPTWPAIDAALLERMEAAIEAARAQRGGVGAPGDS